MDQTARTFAEGVTGTSVLVERLGTITTMLPVAFIDAPLTPMRHSIDDERLTELMDDIRRKGLLQNLGVVPTLDGERIAIGEVSVIKLREHEASGGRYRVAYGHRRLLALRGILMGECMCKVFADLSMPEASIMYSENEKREETTDIDLAVMYAAWAQEDGITETDLCKRAGKTAQFIYDRIALLEGWQEVADALKTRKIKYAVARVLNRVEDESYMKYFLNMAIDGGATQRIVDGWVREYEARLQQAVLSTPPPVGGVTVTSISPTRPECLVCGDTQSYNLRAVMVCQNDIDQIRELRKAREVADGEAAPQ